MTTMILWRPLTFWDEAQIEFIKDNDIKIKLESDKEFINIRNESRELDNKIESLETERDKLYSELEVIGKKYWIKKNSLYKFI